MQVSGVVMGLSLSPDASSTYMSLECQKLCAVESVMDC